MSPAWLLSVTTAGHITLCSCFPNHPASTTSGVCPIHLQKLR